MRVFQCVVVNVYVDDDVYVDLDERCIACAVVHVHETVNDDVYVDLDVDEKRTTR